MRQVPGRLSAGQIRFAGMKHSEDSLITKQPEWISGRQEKVWDRKQKKRTEKPEHI